MDSQNVNWPQEHTVLVDTTESWNTAFTATGWPRDMFRIALSYQTAAEQLITDCDEGRMDPDHVVFSFLFLWRHHVELLLKVMITQANYASGQQQKPPFGHRLDQLWNELRPLLSTSFPSETATLDKCEKIILQLAALDSDGTAFRYVFDEKGKWILSPSVERINLIHFHEALDGVSNALSAAYDMLNEGR